MPKLKTHQGTAKRIWKTASGKLMTRHARRSHHQGRKTTKQKLVRGEARPVPKSNPRIAKLLPY